MDTKYKSHSFVKKLWIATTIFIFVLLICRHKTQLADTCRTETITEVVTAPAREASAAPDRLN